MDRTTVNLSICGKRFTPPASRLSLLPIGDISRAPLAHMTSLPIDGIHVPPQKLRRFSPLSCSGADEGTLPYGNENSNGTGLGNIASACESEKLTAKSNSDRTGAHDLKREPAESAYSIFSTHHWYNGSTTQGAVPLERAAFEKVRAEIAEILSPMSDVSHSPLQHHQNHVNQLQHHSQRQQNLWCPGSSPMRCSFQPSQQHCIMAPTEASPSQPFRHEILVPRDHSPQPQTPSNLQNLPSSSTAPVSSVISLSRVPTMDEAGSNFSSHSAIGSVLASAEETVSTPTVTTATTVTTNATDATTATTCSGIANRNSIPTNAMASNTETHANDYYLQNNSDVEHPVNTINTNETPVPTFASTAPQRRKSTARRRSSSLQNLGFIGGVKNAGRASTTCAMCGKTYTESSNLSKHIRTVHLKLRPFSCTLCGARFAERNKLGKHVQSVHERARPFRCDVCSATFSQASDRKRHRLVLHEGCRPFACKTCGKAFGRRSSLTQHCARVHKALAAAAHNQSHSHAQQHMHSASLAGQTSLQFGTVPHLVSQPLVAPPMHHLHQQRIQQELQGEEEGARVEQERSRLDPESLTIEHTQPVMSYSSLPSHHMTTSQDTFA